MRRFNRRDFLKLGGMAFGSAALARLLAACGIRSAPPTPSQAPTSIPASTSTVAIPAATSAPGEPPTAVPTAAAIPDLAVTRGGEPEALVRGAIDALGGMSRFVAQGANVVIKPNICVAYHTYEYAATTNPWVVGTLVKLCFEAGAASVKVFDFPFGGTQQAAYAISGIPQQVEAAGGKMVPMPSFKFETTRIPNAERLNLVNVFQDVLTADTVINVPIGKVHDLSRLTLGMKNLMGVVLDRPELHSGLSQNLTDLASLIRPKLTVLDAVRIMVSHGPTGGSLDDVKILNTVVAGPDIVAVDAYGASLFGLQPHDLPSVVIAAKRGLGRSDLENLRIQEIQLG